MVFLLNVQEIFGYQNQNSFLQGIKIINGIPNKTPARPRSHPPFPPGGGVGGGVPLVKGSFGHQAAGLGVQRRRRAGRAERRRRGARLLARFRSAAEREQLEFC